MNIWIAPRRPAKSPDENEIGTDGYQLVTMTAPSRDLRKNTNGQRPSSRSQQIARPTLTVDAASPAGKNPDESIKTVLTLSPKQKRSPKLIVGTASPAGKIPGKWFVIPAFEGSKFAVIRGDLRAGESLQPWGRLTGRPDFLEKKKAQNWTDLKDCKLVREESCAKIRTDYKKTARTAKNEPSRNKTGRMMPTVKGVRAT
ncbi:hypothetical protein K439DRAFT_1616077 [Ramaria rubella]|nr:hypothetical protein K439DRAFT_1616077 [Ramaria rubella]